MWNDPDAQHRPHLSGSHLNMSSKGRKGWEMTNENMQYEGDGGVRVKVKQRRSKVTVTDHPLHHFMLCSSSASFGIFFYCSTVSLGVGCCAHLCVYTLMILSPPSPCFQPPTTFSPVFPFSLPPPASLSLASLPLSLSLWLWVISSSTTNQACPKFTHAL